MHTISPGRPRVQPTDRPTISGHVTACVRFSAPPSKPIVEGNQHAGEILKPCKHHRSHECALSRYAGSSCAHIVPVTAVIFLDISFQRCLFFAVHRYHVPTCRHVTERGVCRHTTVIQPLSDVSLLCKFVVFTTGRTVEDVRDPTTYHQPR